MQLARSHAAGAEAVPTEAAAALVVQAAGSLQDVAAQLRRGPHAALRPSDVLAPLSAGGPPHSPAPLCRPSHHRLQTDSVPAMGVLHRSRVGSSECTSLL